MKTIQDLLNELTKYAARMIHQLDIYTFCKWFISALRDTLRNEVLKKGYTAEFSTIKQIFETARMIEGVPVSHQDATHGEHWSHNQYNMGYMEQAGTNGGGKQACNNCQKQRCC